MSGIWEDMVALKAGSDEVSSTVGAAKEYLGEKLQARFDGLTYEEALERDNFPLPTAKGREGYYGENHLNYWMSGLKDSTDILKIYEKETGEKPSKYLDFGGASARVARHMALQHDIPSVWIADINREHVNFVLDTFEGQIKAFQSTSIPHLPLEDNSFDFISAFSVFSHIESFDETWLLELRRILKPGGILVVTANVDTFQDITENWPVYNALVKHPEFDRSSLGKPLEVDRKVVRWNNRGSYSSIVYLTSQYVERRWKPFFSDMKVVRYLTQFQSGVVLRK